MDPVQNFGFPQYDPKYTSPAGQKVAAIADDLTFCSQILAACQRKGLTPQSINTRDFINRCRDNLPETTLTDVTINGVKGHYSWSFLKGAGNWQAFYPQTRNVFTTYRISGAPTPAGGTVIAQAAKDVATPERCNDFGDGDSGMKPQTAPARAPATSRETLLAPFARVADKIILGGTIIMGGILLFITRGALPPAPVTPSITPTIDRNYRRDEEA